MEKRVTKTELKRQAAEYMKQVRTRDYHSLKMYYDMICAGRFKFPRHMGPVAKGLTDLRIQKLMIIVGPGSGKSFLISEVYPAWVLGWDPTETFIGVSGGEELIQGFMSAAMQIIEFNHGHRFVFPKSKPDKNRGWSTDRGMFVVGNDSNVPDPNYWAAGLMSKTLPGRHAKNLIMDDIHNKENSSTYGQILSVRSVYYNTILGRANPSGARFLIAGRRWHEDDLYGHLMKTGDWVVMVLPNERPGAQILYWDVFVPVNHPPCVFTNEHPNSEVIYKKGDNNEKVPFFHIKYKYGVDPLKKGFYWPGSKQKRSEMQAVKRASPADYQSTYQCNPGSREGSIFIESDFAYYVPNAIPKGEGTIIVQSWDTAFSAGSEADFSVCVTGMLVNCNKYHRGEKEEDLGPCDDHYDVLILDVYRDKLEFGDLTNQARIQALKWKPNVVVVEKKASGISLIQNLIKMGMNVEGMPADVSKKARAIQGVGAGSVQGWFRLHRVLFNPEAEWLEDLKKELKDFIGDESGIDDQVDAIVHLVIYAIRLGGGLVMMPTEWTTADLAKIDRMMDVVTDRRGPLDNIEQKLGLDAQVDPFEGRCGRCLVFNNGFCPKVGRSVVPLDIQPCFESEQSVYVI